MNRVLRCMWSHVDEQLMSLFMKHPQLRAMTKEMEKRVNLAEVSNYYSISQNMASTISTAELIW